MNTTEPTDKELVEFVTAFAGLTNRLPIPDYLTDLNAWHNDVWPRIKWRRPVFVGVWLIALRTAIGNDSPQEIVNADARSRCVALWNTLDGKLPEPE